MQAPKDERKRARNVPIRVIALLLLAFVPTASARTRKQRTPLPVTVVLEPFLVARSVIHTVADPVVRNAPRAVAALTTTPVRVAYLTPGPAKPGTPDRGTISEEDQIEPPAQNSGGQPTVAGSRAILRNGIAYAPARAPRSVKNAIWAANSLRGKPYVWGGGHGSFYDRGYDCSGTVSYALRGAGAIASPLPSRDLMRYGERGRGHWITIYARSGHTFAVIAGLRLDTTDFRNGGNIGPDWHAEMRDTRGYVSRHPAGL